VKQLLSQVETAFIDEKRRESEVMDYINRKNYKIWVAEKAAENHKLRDLENEKAALEGTLVRYLNEQEAL